jgi:hypothetical protein
MLLAAKLIVAIEYSLFDGDIGSAAQALHHASGPGRRFMRAPGLVLAQASAQDQIHDC